VAEDMSRQLLVRFVAIDLGLVQGGRASKDGKDEAEAD